MECKKNKFKLQQPQPPSMPLLSRPLCYLTKKGGEIVWKEESALCFPRPQRHKNAFRAFFGGLLSPIIVLGVFAFYFPVRAEFNPDSWQAGLYNWFYLKFLSESFLDDTKEYKVIHQPHENLLIEDEKIDYVKLSQGGSLSSMFAAKGKEKTDESRAQRKRRRELQTEARGAIQGEVPGLSYSMRE